MGFSGGDRVTGTVWRGVVVVVAQGDFRQSSADAPRDEPQMAAAVGTFAGLLAALALMFGAVHPARPRDPGFFTRRPYGKWLVVVMGAACAVVGLSAVWAGLPWLLVPTLCGAVVAVSAWFLHRDLRLGRVGRTRPAANAGDRHAFRALSRLRERTAAAADTGDD
ncbi:hypothetical protein GCM10010211_43740 [Streptomyces albospinus]|uniref:Integral membrane protein n=1 Tax=Streptomyces albospinus TaxID=285515 RepID=A0ABQ2V7X3_9ACTN|nr:hypothetical protein [Streptomyces albospinus]GGU73135.1 hypothetical protein GCM10010211_43740 [Streptomyces albospinus]